MGLPYIARIEHYEPFIGGEAVERILSKASKMSGRRIVHINSTFYGGGVAELLGSMTSWPTWPASRWAEGHPGFPRLLHRHEEDATPSGR